MPSLPTILAHRRTLGLAESCACDSENVRKQVVGIDRTRHVLSLYANEH